MKKQFLSLMVAAAFAATMTACNSTKTESASQDSAMMDSTAMMDSASTMTSEGVEVGGAMMVPSKNIVENAVGSSDHTTLVAAVQAAGLAETLSGTGPFTVFAPTNAAFAKVPKATLDNLMKPEMKADLTKVLTYHVVPGALMAADLKDGQELTTVQGQKLKVTVKDGKVWVGGATVTIPDVVSSNGVTHVIDGVLMPN
ncbi:fasciclin domain-containing protein [Daejeonella lutea]|uniref:Uncaracterized surface protein containing fasciclin (FAS1) repeats n=1 Tax=Daejeonella lutea TaxID=572036 RepID=A0A1T5BIT0_9SPHI|nr:fasciclin domain-containing protein [Daejeonella lutea]SKB46919.1 Uncaracterized surface protein containing fasciclin (FAS1) repeats [Daejeonella lutea]